jgi:predicted transposase YbfD/YdcC
MSSLSLADALANFPDPRSHRGRRFPLLPVLSLLTLGLLLGRKSLDAIARLGHDYGPCLLLALGFPRRRNPVKSTLSRLLRRCDPQALERCLARWVDARLPANANVFSLDGKTLRGSRQRDLPGQHLLAAYAPQVEAVLGQLRVDAKTNEHKAALQLLGILPLRDKVVLGDAAFCQRDVAAKIVGAGGDYVFTVKANQPGLETDIEAGFAFAAAAQAVAAAFSPAGAQRGGGAKRDLG